MIKFAPIALAATISLFAVAPAALHAEETQSVQAATESTAAASSQVSVNAGQMLYSTNGSRVASVYRVSADGKVQVIIDGRLITVPASTLSEADGKVVTTMTKSELRRAGR